MTLVTLNDLKTYLGISLVDTSYDDFLNYQNEVVSEAIQNYCNRIFLEASYTQTFYADELTNLLHSSEFYLYHFPLTSITGINKITTDSDGNDASEAITDYRVHLPSARIIETTASKLARHWFCSSNQRLEVEYEAGYATLPATIKYVVYSLVEEAYNKKRSGVIANFGKDVQRISIPGTLSIDFDYTLQSNERKIAYGMILGNYVNVLDDYRSERSLVGAINLNYLV
jgi:hypothetical protein